MAQRTEYQKEYYLKNKERIQARDKARDKEIREYRRKHYQENKEIIDNRNKNWKEKNKEKYNEWMKSYNHEWYLKHKEEVLKRSKKYHDIHRVKLNTIRNKSNRRYGIKKRYGMELETFLSMLEKQNGRCAICNNIFRADKDTNVDHCHVTGKTRALLCFKCNVGIGRFNDSIELVEKALEYLKKWHSNLQHQKKPH